MNTTAELNKEDLEKCRVTITTTMTYAQWEHIRQSLRGEKNSQGWSGTKADYVDHIGTVLVTLKDQVNKKFEFTE
jgi:hypothetical protein